jgi:hypothetical protein
MVPLKIQCGCGQRYAFEVEAVGGRMPTAVACPVCGTDGTEAANIALAQSIPAQPAVAASRGSGIRINVGAPAAHAPTLSVASAPAPRTEELQRGQVTRSQAEAEARAKISWGDAPEEVVKFLMIQGFQYGDADAMVKEMFAERAKVIRRNGVKKIFIGAGLVCVPIVAVIVFLMIGFFPIKIFGITVVVGLWGAWTVLKGIIMFVAPKSEPGDVADQ